MLKISRGVTLKKACAIVPALIILSIQLTAQKADYRTQVTRYILKYRDAAVREMKISGIPASITMAQGILESNAGQSPLAKEANNHFGIKCHKDWTGETYFQDDDRPSECFRKYRNASESFHDHSTFLVQRDRYRSLFNLGSTDYKGWARGLKSAGYATLPTYAEQLIKTIEKYRLFELDRPGTETAFIDSLSLTIGEPLQPEFKERFEIVAVTSDSHRIYRNNRLQLTLALRGDDLRSLSSSFRIPMRRLRRYNDLPDDQVVPGQIIYLEAKRRKAETATHVVQQGETLYRISQEYGIKIKMLYKRNGIPKGAEPKAGRLLRLR